MKKAALLALAALLSPAALASTQGTTLLEAEGRLLVGAGGLEVGEPGEPLPADVNATGPVTHAAHDFTVPDCPRFLLVEAEAHTLGTDDGTWNGSPAFDPALVAVEVRTPNGTELAGEFGREFSFATNGSVGPGPLELHVTHLVGGPVTYNATVTARPGPACP